MTTAAQEVMKTNLVAEAIRDHPDYVWDYGLIIEQIATALGLSYQGARNYIAMAIQAGVIEQVPRPGRQLYYRLPSPSKMPRFSFSPKANSEKIPIDRAAQAFSSGKFQFLTELPGLPLAIAQFYDIAVRTATGARVPPTELKEIKLVLGRLQVFSRNLLKVTQEMLDEEKMWDANTLAESLLLDPESPMTTDDARTLYETIYRAYGSIE